MTRRARSAGVRRAGRHPRPRLRLSARHGAAVLLAVATACSNSTLPDSAAGGGSQGGQVEVGSTGTLPGSDTVVDDLGEAATGTTLAGSTRQASRGGTAGPAPGVGGAPSPGAPQPGPGGEAPVAGSSVGVTQTSIKVSVSAPFSGVLAPFVQKLYQNAFEVWQAEVNANGGIHGRRIELVAVDNKLTADGAIAACKGVQGNGTFMVVNVLGVTTEADCEDAAGIPVLAADPDYLRPWKHVLVYSYHPALAPAQVSFLRSPYMNAANKKIGIVYLSDQPNTVAQYKAMRAELEKNGMNVVHVEEVSSNQASFVSQMSRMRGAGAETVVMLVALEGAGIVRDARVIGYRPQWYGGTAGAANDISARAGGEEYRGVKALRRMTTAETTQFAAYREKVRQFKGDAAAQSADTVDMGYYAIADVFGEMLERAGPNLTRESFVAAARTLENYDNGLRGPFSLKGRQVGQLAVFPSECCNPDFTYKSIGPPAERF